MRILEEFWYGNIKPMEYDANDSKEYKEVLRLITKNEEKLRDTMTDEQKELFTRVIRTQFVNIIPWLDAYCSSTVLNWGQG